jgi:hypothetical protein
MARKASGLSFVLVLAALVTVLLLAAKAWQKVAPTAAQINSVQTPAAGNEAVSPASEQPGTLPDLNQMRQQTGTHVEQVKEALAKSQ